MLLNGCNGLDTFDATVMSLESYTFDDCGFLNGIIFDEGITNIPDYAFNGSFVEIEIVLEQLPNVISIGKYAFSKNAMTTNLCIPGNIKEIGMGAFSFSQALVNVTLMSGLTEINSSAFEGCSILKTVNIPNTVTKVSSDSFYGCSSLNTITVDELNEVYDSRENCNAIIQTNLNRLVVGCKNTVIPSTVTQLGSGAYGGCTSITEFIIPENIQKILNCAFEDCKNLKEIIVPKNVTSIGNGAFDTGYINGTIIWGYKDSYVQEYCENNGLKFQAIDAEITDISVEIKQTEYKAFETVNTDGMYINVLYEDGRIEEISQGISIKYAGENTSFRFGDTYFTVSCYNERGEYIEKQVNVNVIKATPEYTIPTDITANIGQKLSDIALPEGFSWMDDSQDIKEAGNVGYKARYTPEDKNNYEIVENIEVIISVNKIAVKIPTKVEKTYIYTGSEQYFLLMNFDESKMKITGNARKDAGEQTVTVALLNSNYKWEDGTTRNITFVFKIEKAVPQYSVPTGLTAIVGQKLSEISLPKGFTWMDASQTIQSAGSSVYKAKYTPTDTKNYEIVKNIEITVDVDKIKVKIPTEVEKTYIYNGNIQYFELNNYDSFKMTKRGDARKDAGEQTVTVALSNSNYKWEDGTTSNITFVFKIEKAVPQYSVPTNIKAKVGQKLSEIELPERFAWMDDTQIFEGTKNEGYQARYIPEDINNYKIVENIQIPIIEVLKIPTKVEKNYQYNGKDQCFELNNFDSSKIKITGNVRKDVGEQTVTVSLLNSNYVWEDGTTKDITFKFVINKMPVKIPKKVEKTYIYTGSDQYLLLMNFDDSKMKITGNVRKDAGEQTATISLLNSNYVWEDGTTKNITFNFKIEKANPNYVSASDYVGVFDGKAHSINLNINTTGHTVKYSVNNKNYDLSTMPTFKEIGEYTVNYKITKNNYNDVIGSKKVCIYGVQKLDSTLELRNNILVVKNYNNNFQDICNRIKLFATSHTYKHYDKNKALTNNSIANTGDSIKLNINNLKEYEYAISVLGDVNGDGKISALDYVKIKNHIMKTNLISSDVYLTSADVNDDGKISALDYVRIKNRIMNGGV